MVGVDGRRVTGHAVCDQGAGPAEPSVCTQGELVDVALLEEGGEQIRTALALDARVPVLE